MDCETAVDHERHLRRGLKTGIGVALGLRIIVGHEDEIGVW
jgi:hypothetical protein